MNRRIFLKGTLAGSAMATAIGAGLVTPSTVLARSAKAFDAESVDNALDHLYGDTSMEDDDSIKIKAPDIAENGAVVPITVESDRDDIESIAIISEKNPTPLTSRFKLGDKTHGFVSTRIKMGETSDVIALVRANGTSYTARKEVKVTVGGCGG
ncbi:MAG: thiosulfate oxidation carrier protein SoxY [Thiohalospira sp.]